MQNFKIIATVVSEDFGDKQHNSKMFCSPWQLNIMIFFLHFQMSMSQYYHMLPDGNFDFLFINLLLVPQKKTNIAGNGALYICAFIQKNR